MRVLDVWLQGTRIGRITEGRKGGRFEYVPEVSDAYPGLPLLSLAFPVKRNPFGISKTANWFEGLLPEGERRIELCRRVGVSPYDWMGLLAEIGWECAGAVQVFAEGERCVSESGYEPLEAEELARRLNSFVVREPQGVPSIHRMSLGGYQNKMCIAMPRLAGGADYVVPDAAMLPVGDAPSTHILKPEPLAYPGLAESEAWAMTAASYAARSARVALLQLPNSPATLVVERYDREGSGWPDGVVRVHQEDACQAMGLSPLQKYASTGIAKGDDPSYARIAKLLVVYAMDPEMELRELLRQLAVNLVLGNWDAHAKNTSFLYRKLGVPELAPLYDVVPVADVEPRASSLSMRVEGSLDPQAVSRAVLLEEAAQWGLGSTGATLALDGALAGLDEGIAEASRRYPKAAGRHASNAKARLAALAKG